MGGFVLRYWRSLIIALSIVGGMAMAGISVVDQHGNPLDVQLVVTVPGASPGVPVPVPDPVLPEPTPEPVAPPVPVEQGDVVAAIEAMAPAQHATHAVFKQIPGSEIDTLMYCDAWAADPDWQAAVAASGSTTTPDQLKCYKPEHAFVAWVGGAWNWNDFALNVPAGGGHGDFGGNQLHVGSLIAPDGALAVDWTMPIGPQPLTHGACGAPVYGPASEHTYASPVYVESQDETWHWVGSGAFPRTSYCDEATAPVAPGMRGWTNDGKAWTKRDDRGQGGPQYPRGCYLPEIDRIVMLGNQTRHMIDPGDGYRMWQIPKLTEGYISSASHFDTAADGDICYEYVRGKHIKGIRYDQAGPVETVFTSRSAALNVPSLSVERSTGNLVAVGINGYALHIDVQTGEETDISAPTGIVSTKGKGAIYGKFDMIPLVPCVGVGVDDPRNGMWLMTLPANVCQMGAQQPAVPPIDDPVEPAPLPAEVVFRNPLTSIEHIPTTDWWHAPARIKSSEHARAEFDPDMQALKLTRTDLASSSGLFMTNFSPDYSVQFGEGEAFAVEFEYRLNCNAVYMDCDPESPAYQTDRRPFYGPDGRVQGAKIAIIAEGAVPDDLQAPACDVIQIVIRHTYGTLRAFNDCGRYTPIEVKAGMAGGSVQLERNSGEDYSCLRFPITDPKTGESFKYRGTGPNCAYLEPDQWMRIKAVIHVGTWGKPDTRFQLFFALEGEEYGEVIDQIITVRPPNAPHVGYGAVHFQMHSTNSETGLGDPDRVAWYRNLFVSRVH